MVKTQTTTKAKVLTAITVAAAGVAAYAVGMLPLSQQTDDNSAQRSQCQNACAAQQDSCINAVAPSDMQTTACIKAFNECASACTQQFPVQTITSQTTPTSQTGFVVRPSSGTIELPSATYGQPYDVMLVLDGQTSPVQWKMAGGAAPQGIIPDEGGHLSGVVMGVGTYDFSLNMHSPSGAFADMEQKFSIVIAGPAAPAAGGSGQIQIFAPLNMGGAPSAQIPIFVPLMIGGKGLSVVQPFPPQGRVNEAYAFQYTVTGGPTTGFTKWKVLSGDPIPGLQLSEDGLLSGTPTQAGTYNLMVLVDRVPNAGDSVSDTRGIRMQTSITIQSATAATVPLRIQTKSVPAATVGVTYTSQLGAYGGRGAYRWEPVGEMPIGMALNQFGLLVGTPSRAGTYTITARVTADSSSGSMTDTVPLTFVVNERPSTLVVPSQVLPDGKVGVAYQQTVKANGGQGSFSWSVISGLPATLGLSLSSDGVLSGTPAKEGIYTIRVKVTDSQTSQQGDVVVNIVDKQATIVTPDKTVPATTPVVTDKPVVDQPVKDQPVTDTGTAKKDVVTQPVVNSGAAADDTAKKLALNLPTGATGTPVKDDKAVTVTDPKATSVDTKVGAPVAFLNVGSYPTGFVSYYYNARPFDVTGGTGTYTWSVVSGSLPNGLTLGSRGEVTGTPSKTGSFSFTMQVQDDKGESVRANRVIDIRAATEYTTVTGTPVSNDPQLTARLNKLSSIGVNVHDLIKLQDDGNPDTQYDTTVYYIGTDGRRHAFPNNRVYFTWFSDYSRVRIIAPYDLSDIQLGANITYRPGTHLVKFMSNNKVYAVDTQRRLRWIRTAEIAQWMYGSSWMYGVDDISDAFYLDYQFGADIASATDFNAAAAANNTVYPSQTLPE